MAAAALNKGRAADVRRAGCDAGDVPADTSGWREREEGEGAAGRSGSRGGEGEERRAAGAVMGDEAGLRSSAAHPLRARLRAVVGGDSTLSVISRDE